MLKHRKSPGKHPFEFEKKEEHGSVSMTVKIFDVVYFLARDGDSITFTRDAADKAILSVEPHHTSGSFKLRCGEDYLRHSQNILIFERAPPISATAEREETLWRARPVEGDVDFARLNELMNGFFQ